MDLDPETNSKLNLRLFKGVKNAKDIKEQIVKGIFKCCVIKPSLILDPFQVIVAANKAVVSDKLTTKTIYTEILFNLSTTKNITKSLKTFGIDDEDENILVVTLQKGDEDDDMELFKQIGSEEEPLENLINYTDLNLIKKIYKISEKETKVTPILDSIVSRIATKEFLSF